MISCIEWIPKGVADPNPKRYELSKAERELLESDVQEGTEEVVTDEEEMDQDNQETNDNAELLASQEKSASEIIASQPLDPSSLPDDLRMEDYSDDDSDDGAKQRDIGSLLIGNEDTGLGIDEDGNFEDDVIEKDSEDEEDDDNLDDVPDTREYTPSDIKGLEAMSFGGYTGQADFEIEDDGQEDSDAEDTNLRPDDALVVVARVQEDFASLEINVYEETTGNLFVHHDIPLPAYPLCLAHGTINSDGGAGNYIAVGTFEPGIEIWNADILNALEPAVILGGEDTADTDAKWVQSLGGKSQARPNMNKRNGLKPGSHTDAIMSLSWNTIHRQVIASGSADKTVKLWDVTKAHDANGGVAATLTHHTGKVQSTVWHPTEGTILATGSYDRTVAIVDARSTSSVKKVKYPPIANRLHGTHIIPIS
jgi:AAA ATPase containing von Willebrand factor type A (vWA) domain